MWERAKDNTWKWKNRKESLMWKRWDIKEKFENAKMWEDNRNVENMLKYEIEYDKKVK